MVLGPLSKFDKKIMTVSKRDHDIIRTNYDNVIIIFSI